MMVNYENMDIYILFLGMVTVFMLMGVGII